MKQMVKIENCTCIETAEIEIEEGALNIKYGLNGTGKSTISKAIYAKACGNDEELAKLKTYGTEIVPKVQNLKYRNVMVFNEDYVNSYLFRENSFLENSYQVFLHTDECEQLAKEITRLLEELQGMFISSDEIRKLREFLPSYFTIVKFSNGQISRRGGVGELLNGNGGGFEKHKELIAYRPFFENRDMARVTSWASWRNEGIQQIVEEKCPFCTHDMDAVIEQQNEIISRVFKKSALSTVQKILAYLEKGIAEKYINEDVVKNMKRYIGDEEKKDELEADLKQIAMETEYLSSKIEKICLFRPMNVTQEEMDEIESNLMKMLIDEDRISRFYATEFVINLSREMRTKIERLKENTGKLKGLFRRHQDKMNKLIEERQEDINHFFLLAGFPYRFVLKAEGERKATSYLVPIASKETRVENPEMRLSWGEKNSFSLVMFMFEAVSECADLIILDDPITSFDKDKKFAVIRRLFDKGKTSLKDSTVLMFTHDLQPIIDYVHNSMFKKYHMEKEVSAMYLQNEAGTIKEYEIQKDDLINIIEMTKHLAEDSDVKLPVRIVNLRKYVELTEKNLEDFPLYEVLSNIVHGREEPTYKNGEPLSEQVLKQGWDELRCHINFETYEEIISELCQEKLLGLVDADDMYVKVIAIRLLFERNDSLLKRLRKKYPAAYKFVNESNHVENDYVFQLNPLKYYSIPECYLMQLKDFLENDSDIKKNVGAESEEKI